MDRETYKLLKRRVHVTRQRALASDDPLMWREYQIALRERHRAYCLLWPERAWDDAIARFGDALSGMWAVPR